MPLSVERDAFGCLIVYNNCDLLLHASPPVDIPRQQFGPIMLFVIRGHPNGPGRLTKTVLGRFSSLPLGQAGCFVFNWGLSMGYDFTTRIDRSKTSSFKWKRMHEADPHVPAGVIPMTMADMEFATQPEMLSLIHRLADEGVNLGYPSASDSYFKAVLDWQAHRHGFKAERDWVVMAPGVAAALYASIRAFTEPGDGVIIQEPAPPLFRSALERNGRKVVANPLTLDDTRYEFDFVDLERRCSQPSTKALILCSPHSPVGRVWSYAELRRLADVCLANDVLIIADETYNDLVLPPYEHASIMEVLGPDERGRSVLLTTPSKTFNLAGCQCANAFVPDDEMRERLKAELLRAPFVSLNAFAYPICEVAYRECEGWLDELLVVLAQNRETLSSFFSANMPNVGVVPLEGTYLQWLDMRAWGLSDEELRAFMEHDARLFVTPGCTYGQQGSGFARMNIACPSQALKEALSRLFKAARARELT